MTDLIASIARRPDGSTIELTRHFRTTPEDLWHAIVAPERAARWLGDITGELHENGNYRIAFDASDPDAMVSGGIRRCVPGSELVVGWQAPGEPVSIVSVTLTAADGGTDLHLVHEGLDDNNDAGHAAGWQVHLDQLASGVEADDWQDQWERWPELNDAYRARAQARD